MSKAQFNKAIGIVLRQQRKKHGLTQAAIAERLGFSYQNIQKYEVGTNGCSAEVLARFAAIFHVSVAELYQAANSVDSSAIPDEADNDAFMAAHYVRKMPESMRRALIPYLQRMAYSKGEPA